MIHQFGLALEWVRRRQGEETAALRLLRRLPALYGSKFFDILLVDALYAESPMLKLQGTHFQTAALLAFGSWTPRTTANQIWRCPWVGESPLVRSSWLSACSSAYSHRRMSLNGGGSSGS